MRCYLSSTLKDFILPDLRHMQTKLHSWGERNRVTFDASKESFHILSRRNGYGGSFKLLGITFDPELSMYAAIQECVGAANWKLQALLRTKRFFTDAEIIQVFKAHVLSFIEYRTPAIAHATPSLLQPLNDILTRLLVRLGVAHEEALFHFNLAPLETRRDIAQLGVIHRAALRQGPNRLHYMFARGQTFLGHSMFAGPCSVL